MRTKEQIQDYLIQGKHYEDLTREEKVALAAQKITEIAPDKNFIDEINDRDVIAQKLLDWLAAWNLSNEIKSDKRFDFEDALIKAMQKELENDFEFEEHKLRIAANDVDNQDAGFY